MTSITRIDEYRALDYKREVYCLLDYYSLEIIEVPGGTKAAARAVADEMRQAMPITQAIDIRDSLLQMGRTIMENPC